MPYTAIPVAVIEGAKSHAQLGAAVDLIRYAEKRRFVVFAAADSWLAKRWRKSVGFARGVIALLAAAEALVVVSKGDRNNPRRIQVVAAVVVVSKEHDEKHDEEHDEEHAKEHANRASKPDISGRDSRRKARRKAPEEARRRVKISEDLSDTYSEGGNPLTPKIEDEDPLSSLGLSPALVASLAKGGVENVGALAGLSSRQLLVEQRRGAARFARVGPAAISKIEAALAASGRTLKTAKRGRPDSQGARSAGAAYSAAWRAATATKTKPGKPYPWPKHEAGIRQCRRACQMLAEAYGIEGGEGALEDLQAAATVYLNSEGGNLEGGAGPWGVYPFSDPPGLLKFVGSAGRQIERWKRAGRAGFDSEASANTGEYLSDDRTKYSGSNKPEPVNSLSARYGNGSAF